MEWHFGTIIDTSTNMFKKVLLFILVSYNLGLPVVLPASATTPDAPSELKAENLVNPIGLDATNPRFSWVDTSSTRGMTQSAYQIIVASSQTNLNANTGDMWDSGKVISSAQSSILYAGSTLLTGTKYWWKVRIYDQRGNVSSYSPAATFETGMFSTDDWQASSWIGGDYYLLRDDFVLDSAKTIATARVYIASLGWNEVYINGQKVGNDVLNTGYTELDKRVLYATYDVKSLLNSSTNGVGIWLGGGCYTKFVCPALGIPYQKAARMEIRVTFTDGTSFRYGTNPNNWKALKGGPITYDDIYNGEHYDATRESAWSNYGFDDSSWPAPTQITYTGAITAQYTSIKVTADISPVSTKIVSGVGPSGYTLCALEGDTVNFATATDVAFGADGAFVYKTGQTGAVTFSTNWFGSDPALGAHKLGFLKNSSGTIPTYIVDMGNSMAGWAKISLYGPRGSKVMLRYAESVKADGNLQPIDLRGAQQTDTYVLKGGGAEVYEPRFTCHGFRYVEISGSSAGISFSVTGRAVRNDYSINNVSTSSQNMNKILAGVRGAVMANSVAVLTDVCSRDERSTSGGDAYLSAESALLNFDMQTFYEKNVADVDYEQHTNGMVPCCCPSYAWPWFTSMPWNSHRILIPWNLYMATGDKNVLASHYAKMTQSVDYLASIAPRGYLGLPNDNGDWVPSGTTEGNQFFGDAFFYRNVDLMAKIASELGNLNDVVKFNTLATNIQNAFNAKYFNSNGYYGNNTQAGNAVALEFGLVPTAYKSNVLNSLVNAVISNKNHFTTGILGTKSLIEALWQNNRSDLVFSLLNQTDYPSFLDMMKVNGLTAEHWNPDAYIGSGMNSFNHHMFGGGPGAWMVKGAAGISPALPGYEQILIRPEIVGDLTSATATVNSPKGQISCSWIKVGETQINLNVTIPANSTAIVSFPTITRTNAQITEGGTVIYNGEYVSGVSGINGLQSNTDGRIAFNVGSGTYSFVYNFVMLPPAPVIATNTLPATAADVVGSAVTFTASIAGVGPLVYQWQKISAGVTENVPGATNTILTLTNLQLADAASYQLCASNVGGVTISRPSVLTVSSVPGAVNNVVTRYAEQTGLGGSGNDFYTTWTVAPGSLLAGLTPSSVGAGNFSDPYANECGTVAVLTDNSIGYLHVIPGNGGSPTEVACGSGAGQSVTYTLPFPYNLTNITVYGGWGDAGRDSQNYTISYAKQSAPTKFIQLCSANYNPSNPLAVHSATRATFTAASGYLATNVVAVKIDFTTPAPENGYTGYSEIGLYGIPTFITSTNPTNITIEVAADTLKLRWPADHIGWRLQSQTNDVTRGLGTNWVEFAGATATSQMVIPINATNDSVFYRIVYP